MSAQPPTLAAALASPGLPHDASCALVCADCGGVSQNLVRGVAITSNLEPLGILRCEHCDGRDMRFGEADLRLVTAAMTRLLSSPKRLPHGDEAFFRGGEFVTPDGTFASPRDARARALALAAERPSDPAVLLAVAYTMDALRDPQSALEFVLATTRFAPDSPEPLVFLAELLDEIGERDEARRHARDALARRDGPRLVTRDRRELLATAARLAGSAADPSKAAGKVGRNDPCPCASGKKYKKCCGAAA